MSLRRLLLLSIALLPSYSAIAARPDLPPEAVVAQALDHSPAVEAAGKRVQSARAHETMLRRGSGEFVFQGTASRRDVAGDRDYQEFDANITRPFRFPAKAAMDRQAGALGVEVAHNQMEEVRHETALAFSNLWHDWLIAGALYRTDLDTAASLARDMTAIRRRAALRDASTLDVDQAEAALAQAEAQAASSLSARDEASARLLVAFPDIPLPTETPPLPQPELPAEAIEALRAQVIARSHEIRAAEREAQRRTVLARRARADRIADPSFGVRVFSERGGQERGAGIVASMPLGGGYRRAASDQADAEAGAAELDLSQTRRQIEATASVDVANIRSREAVWRNRALSATSAERAATRTSRGYELGQIDLTDTLLVQRQANDARRLEIEARGEMLRSLLKLEIDAHRIWTSTEDHVD